MSQSVVTRTGGNPLRHWHLAAAATALLLAGCSAGERASDPLPEIALARPDVIVEADPPPPYTYWAPAGSTIRVHPNLRAGRGLPVSWIAEKGGRPLSYYHGDQCGAAAYQRFVGHPVMTLEQAGPPEGATLRLVCTQCAMLSDLGYGRMTVVFDDETRIVSDISCR